MSETPRADAEIFTPGSGLALVPLETARQLERELAAAEEEIIRVKGLVIERDGWLPQEERIRLQAELAAAREESLSARMCLEGYAIEKDQAREDVRRLRTALADAIVVFEESDQKGASHCTGERREAWDEVLKQTATKPVNPPAEGK